MHIMAAQPAKLRIHMFAGRKTTNLARPANTSAIAKAVAMALRMDAIHANEYSSPRDSVSSPITAKKIEPINIHK